MSGVKGMPLPDSELAPCGTLAAYRRHLRRGTPVDEACRQAQARAYQDRVAAGWTRPSPQHAPSVHLAGWRGPLCGCGRQRVTDVLHEVTCRNCLRVLRRLVDVRQEAP